jgi:quinol-cytochrome oxidoreductase complex cytochrome b subunit
METACIILACFSGMLGFGFALAGLLGMINFDKHYDYESISQMKMLGHLLDMIVTQGLFFMVSEIARNWSSRPTERRFFFFGVGCLVVFVISLML